MTASAPTWTLVDSVNAGWNPAAVYIGSTHGSVDRDITRLGREATRILEALDQFGEQPPASPRTEAGARWEVTRLQAELASVRGEIQHLSIHGLPRAG